MCIELIKFPLQRDLGNTMIVLPELPFPVGTSPACTGVRPSNPDPADSKLDDQPEEDRLSLANVSPLNSQVTLVEKKSAQERGIMWPEPKLAKPFGVPSSADEDEDDEAEDTVPPLTECGKKSSPQKKKPGALSPPAASTQSVVTTPSKPRATPPKPRKLGMTPTLVVRPKQPSYANPEQTHAKGNTFDRGKKGKEVGREKDGKGSEEAVMTAKLLKLQLENAAIERLKAMRPPPDRRFNGDDEGGEFDAHLKRFEIVTKRDGVTDAAKLLELPHWFAGPALALVRLHSCESKDAGLTLCNVMYHLKNEYSQEKFPPGKLLERILRKEPIAREDATSLQFLIVDLERVYARAKEWGRRDRIGKEVIDSVLARRVKWLIEPWAKECAKQLEEWKEMMPEEELPGVDYSVNTFQEFLRFLRKQRRSVMWENVIALGAPRRTVPESVKVPSEPPVNAEPDPIPQEQPPEREGDAEAAAPQGAANNRPDPGDEPPGGERAGEPPDGTARRDAHMAFQQAVGDPFGKVGFITHVRNVMSSISCFSMNAWSDDKEREGGKCQNSD